MPRPPRIDLAGSYHVINREVNREDILLHDENKIEFLNILEKSREIYHLTVHSFCVLDNHYHLLLETSRNNLSLAIRYLNSQYAIYFNKKMQRSGPLWQGRFKSRYIQDENYLWLLVRYIELNPVRAGLVDVAGEFRFSSLWAVLHGDRSQLLADSLLHKRDVAEWLKPLSESEIAALGGYEKMRQEKREDKVISLIPAPLDVHFEGVETKYFRNEAIWKAFRDGHGQGAIARYLGLSPVAVSRIISREQARRTLFKKIHDKGLFWCYSGHLKYDGSRAMADLMIETVLKYGDIQELRDLRSIFGVTVVKRVWEERVKADLRFKRLNYFLARVFFKIDVEADDFTGGKNVRAEKLRLLVGQDQIGS